MNKHKTPYVRFFWSDWIADTSHLDLMQLGAYMRLLEFVYQHARPLPGDMDKVFRICHATSATEQQAIRGILDEYFKPFEDPELGMQWRHFRAEREIEWASSARKGMVDGGRLGAERRWRKEKYGDPNGDPDGDPNGVPIREANGVPIREANGVPIREANGLANGVPDATQNQNHNQKKRVREGDARGRESASKSGTPATPTARPAARGTRLQQDSLTREWRDICAKHRPDLDPEDTFERFCDYWMAVPGAKGCKLDWTRTWRNWVKGHYYANGKGATNGAASSSAPRTEAQWIDWAQRNGCGARPGESMPAFLSRARAMYEREGAR